MALGVLLRATAAAALSQLLRHVLYGVSNLDPLSYSAAIGLLVAIAAIAALVPASRALRIDPMRALRHEHKILLSGRPLRTGITTASDAGICVAGCSCQVLCKAIVLTEQINSRIMAGGAPSPREASFSDDLT